MKGLKEISFDLMTNWQYNNPRAKPNLVRMYIKKKNNIETYYIGYRMGKTLILVNLLFWYVGRFEYKFYIYYKPRDATNIHKPI